jgi:hypothetical protein
VGRGFFLSAFRIRIAFLHGQCATSPSQFQAQGAFFMIDNWRAFSSDWHSSVFLSSAKLPDSQRNFHQHQTLVALLHTQQMLAAEMRIKRGLSNCRQFVADVRVSSWQNNQVEVKHVERATGFDYEYLAHGRVCFKGNLQFKELFPDWTHLWIFLNALTMAHYLHHACPIDDTGLRRVEPLLKHHKVQFDQNAIDTALNSSIPKLTYTVHKLSVGQYCSHTLSLKAGELTLMIISLGLYRSVKLTIETPVTEVDILID